MKQTAPHSVKAKTGNLNGVTCLSGYITPKTGLPLIFVIMVNRKNKSALMFKRKLEDQLCGILAAHAFSSA
jgi:D-alanyl-D-alanine carboxypeptidase